MPTPLSVIGMDERSAVRDAVWFHIAFARGRRAGAAVPGHRAARRGRGAGPGARLATARFGGRLQRRAAARRAGYADTAAGSRLWAFLVPLSRSRWSPTPFSRRCWACSTFPTPAVRAWAGVPLAMAGMWTIPLWLALFVAVRQSGGDSARGAWSERRRRGRASGRRRGHTMGAPTVARRRRSDGRPGARSTSSCPRSCWAPSPGSPSARPSRSAGSASGGCWAGRAGVPRRPGASFLVVEDGYASGLLTWAPCRKQGGVSGCSVPGLFTDRRRRPLYFGGGEVAEWLKALVSKTSVPLRVPRVRIPLSPPTPRAQRAGRFA